MKDSRHIVILFLLIAMALTMLTVIASATPGTKQGPSVGARAAILYEPNGGRILFAKNELERLPMASTTKIMTALIALEQCNLSDVITVPKEAVGIEGSSVYLSEGTEVTVEDLIYSVLLQSANDAATVLAIHIGGDIHGFADIMNERAAEMGLCDTHFDNPHGLDSEEHYTTAGDLAILASVALQNDSFKEICSTYKYSFNLGDTARTVVNHNKLLKRYNGAFGVKTGFTRKSGRCLVSAAERNGINLIAVTLNDPDDWRDHTALLDFGFSSMTSIPLESICDIPTLISIVGSDKEAIPIYLSGDTNITVLKEEAEELSAKVEMPRYKSAPINIGDELGCIIVTVREKEISRISILAAEQATAVANNKKRFIWF